MRPATAAGRNEEGATGRAKADADLDADRREIVAVAVKLKTPESKTAIRERCQCGHARFGRAFASLVADGTLQEATVTKTNGQTYDGWRVRNDQRNLTPAHTRPTHQPEKLGEWPPHTGPVPYVIGAGRLWCAHGRKATADTTKKLGESRQTKSTRAGQPGCPKIGQTC